MGKTTNKNLDMKEILGKKKILYTNKITIQIGRYYMCRICKEIWMLVNCQYSN